MSRVLCLKCMTVIESKSVHDFRSCGCENESFVDGGGQYLRIGGHDLDYILPLKDDELVYARKRKMSGVPLALGEAIVRAIKAARQHALDCAKSDRIEFLPGEH